MDIPHNLIEEFAKGNGVIFAGPGLARDSGIMGSEELLSNLSERLDLPAASGVNLPKAALYYENRFGRQELLQYVIEQTDTSGKKPNENYYKLLQLGAQTWITTNYDDLIERVFQETGKKFTKIVSAQNLPYTSADSITLVKLHGDRNQQDSMVITQQDYQTYFRRYPRIKEKVAGLLLEKTFLFVGYESNNPEFDQILAEITYDLQHHQRTAYMILAGVDEFTLPELSSHNIKVLFPSESADRRSPAFVGQVLDEFIKQLGQSRLGVPQSRTTNDSTYRDWLRGETDTIDIRGIGNRNAPGRFPLFNLYIPLHAHKIYSSPGMENSEGRVSLDELLDAQKHTILIGGPGTGKTTYLRYLARKAVDNSSLALPLLMRASGLYDFLNQHGRAQTEFSSTQLVGYWLRRSEDHGWGFLEAWFQNQLKQGKVQFLLDGLDELPDERAREQITQLIDASVKRWPKCKWVLTSRPTVYQSFTYLDFSIVSIEQLTEDDIRKFVHSWVNTLYQGLTLYAEPRSTLTAMRYEQELLEAIRDNKDVKLLARNPVMLTAIVVMHWNEMRLPAGKAELYRTIINWLIRARRDYPQKPNEKVALDCYQRIALSMFNHPDGVQTSVGRVWAAEQIADQLPNPDRRDKIKVALEFLEYEEINTGIVVSREGGNVAFWHFSFQEYLTAYEIATKTDDESTGWWSSLRDNLFNPQWIEVLRFVPTIFYVSLGRARVDLFVRRILSSRRDNSLVETARVVGLLGSVLLDLSVYHYAIDHVDEYLQARDQVMQIFSMESLPLDFQTRYDAAVALGRWGDPRFAHPDRNWIWIPRGTSIIGAQASDASLPNYDQFALPAEGPVFNTFAASFEVGKFPVTVQEYNQFINDHGYETRDFWSTDGWDWRTKNEILAPNHWDEQIEFPNKPVVYVSWFESQAYCSWLSAKDPRMTYRLPTEAEWEYMVRRGRGKNTTYVFGDIGPGEVKEEMNCDRSGSENLAPVGLFPRDTTVDLVLDVNGNIWEWTQDKGEQIYSSGLHQASLTRKQKSYLRYRRGGGWHDVPVFHRTSSRSLVSAQNRYDDTGFRVLRKFSQVSIKGKTPNRDGYTSNLADIYAKYDGMLFSREEATERLKTYSGTFSSPLASSLIEQLFPDDHPAPPHERPLPTLDQSPADKFEFNLYYQDSRIKLGVEEKFGTDLEDIAQYQSQAEVLLEVVSILLSTEGLSGRAVWQDLTDNDLDGLIVMVLDHYDPKRIHRLLEIGHETNRRALLGRSEFKEQSLEDLILYQVFAGTVWWTEKDTTLADQFSNIDRIEIDDRQKFIQEVSGRNLELVFFFDDNGELVWDLALISRLLHDNPNLHITGVVSTQVVFNNASEQTVDTCLNNALFEHIRRSKRFELITEDNPRSAIDPIFCSRRLMDRIKGANLAFIKGVAFFEVMQNLPVDAYFAFVVHSLDSQICTGLEAGRGVFARIPKGRHGYQYRKKSLSEIHPTLN